MSQIPKNYLNTILLVALILMVGFFLYQQNQSQGLSERDNQRLKAQIASGGQKSKGDDSTDPYEKNEVKNTILKGAADKIQSCYKTWVAGHPEFQMGRVVVDWQIRLDGTVERPEIVSSDLEAINSCVIEAISALKFPPPPSDKPWYIVHKFFFKREEPTPKDSKK
jgi:hypothetical protein